ncbi:hypothetical protein CROQUDRAFT_89460 [Cronartium quercuum f. sp. fusiforme G11]|uniref:Uncharacterized protein n=1 Tax=Cronartium quercuum f. sp. fusiforme G11 TaxID=708437 RepID=A0A9P6NRY2_9BASI|nr:hypothetical protein CROQUDRAFT_89460 [Cronartium quercuum f. sp. fusiforme G11]
MVVDPPWRVSGFVLGLRDDDDDDGSVEAKVEWAPKLVLIWSKSSGSLSVKLQFRLRNNPEEISNRPSTSKHIKLRTRTYSITSSLTVYHPSEMDDKDEWLTKTGAWTRKSARSIAGSVQDREGLKSS